jgi:hypothetical protein
VSEDKPKPSTTYGAAATGELGDDTCPSCGVSVPKGYVKCPKCHAVMPRTASPLRRAHTEPGGGTSVSAGRTASLGVMLLVAAATALVVFLANQEDTTPQARAPTVVVASGGPGSESPSADEQGRDAGATDDGEVDISSIALDKLYEALVKAQLFAWVDVQSDERTTVVLQSWYCNNEDLKDAIETAGTELRNNGFERVVCLERAGKQIFDQALR